MREVVTTEERLLELYNEWFPKKRTLENWDFKYLNKTRYISGSSKDPSTKVGAQITTMDFRPMSEGYNGFPQGIPDDPEWLEDRDIKYEAIIHGELNALIFAERSIRKCRLYTYPFMPCSRCASVFSQAGIQEVVAPWSGNPRWIKGFHLALDIFKKKGVKVILVPATQWDPKPL